MDGNDENTCSLNFSVRFANRLQSLPVSQDGLLTVTLPAAGVLEKCFKDVSGPHSFAARE